MPGTLRTLLASWRGSSGPAPGGIDSSSQSESVVLAHIEDSSNRSTHTASAVPYDEQLLERARAQWQFGDWESLLKLDADSLQYHPDRAKLALLAAAAFLQTQNTANARKFIRLAQGWGCGKKMLSQILASGVHNSLGRAAVLMGQEARALKHFEHAIVTGTPGSESKLLAHARLNEQVKQISSSVDVPSLKHDLQERKIAGGEKRDAGLSSREDIGKELIHRTAELVSEMKFQKVELNNLKTSMNKSVKAEVLNATKQIEAFIEVQNYMRTGKILGEMHGWPVSPDFALYFIELIETRDYDLVIEFGSGTSTVLIAKALSNVASRRQGASNAMQISFEHLERYYAKTHSSLRRQGLDAQVELVLAPLESFSAPNGKIYSYYKRQAVQDCLGALTRDKKLHILVVVDGPPRTTGEHARYPAVPVVLESFPSAALDILLDDYGRADEREIAEMWQEIFVEQGRLLEITELPLEKGAVLLKVDHA
jgi:tetratricopeptide (TPR) repeat protein